VVCLKVVKNIKRPTPIFCGLNKKAHPEMNALSVGLSVSVEKNQCKKNSHTQSQQSH